MDLFGFEAEAQATFVDAWHVVEAASDFIVQQDAVETFLKQNAAAALGLSTTLTTSSKKVPFL